MATVEIKIHDDQLYNFRDMLDWIDVNVGPCESTDTWYGWAGKNWFLDRIIGPGTKMYWRFTVEDNNQEAVTAFKLRWG